MPDEKKMLQMLKRGQQRLEERQETAEAQKESEDKSTRGGRANVDAGALCERDVAKLLSDAFRRKFSRRVRKYKGEADLETPEDFPFVIEVKMMESFDVYTALTGVTRHKLAKPQLLKWWEQAQNQCERVKKKRRIVREPMLIWKQKGKGWMASLPEKFMNEFGKHTILHHYGFGIMALSDFCALRYPDIIRYGEDMLKKISPRSNTKNH